MPTDDDAVSLAAGWRERISRGYAGPVTLAVTGAGHTVRVHGARVASYTALYKAHAHAEALARKYDDQRQEKQQ